MKIFKAIVFFCSFLMFGTSIYAQKSNTVYLFTSGNWYIGKAFRGFNPTDQYGIGYHRKVKNNIALDLLFSQWYNSNLGKFAYFRYECSSFDKRCEKKLEYRSYYKFVDILFHYIVYKHKRLGNLNLQLGSGLVWGTNRRIDTIIISNSPPFDYYEDKGHNEAIKLLGIIPGISYDYFLWKSRINLGIHCKARKYFGKSEDFFQLDTGFHLGYNF